jgi:protein AbiQ
MYKKFRIVKIESDYCNYLRKFDKRVSYNYGIKELRQYVGILFEINGIEYFAPFSSPKEKHLRLNNTLDLLKLTMVYLV